MHDNHMFDTNLLAKYNQSGPRYTSYPTALEFSDGFFNDDIIKAIKTSANTDLSLYIHIPFCRSLCYYCGCNKVITRNSDKAQAYLDTLLIEITNRAELFRHHTLSQLHIGGGTPSFLSKAQLTHLMVQLAANYRFAQDAELSIEIDPRGVTIDYLTHLHSLGFNRISIGVQDTNLNVQKAINRVQPTEHIMSLVNAAKQLGFNSVNLDLIYGLPYQNKHTFAHTLADVIQMDPERISLFSYAHLPSRFAAQRKIKDEWLPDPEQKFSLMKQAIQCLTEHGYIMIGMDHFAKPQDGLSRAIANGTLQRNFQGYSTLSKCDLLGVGVSAISFIGDSYSQNLKDLKQYSRSVGYGGHAVDRGLKLQHDDRVRAYVISELMCNLHVKKKAVERRFDIDFDQYFAKELIALEFYVKDNLIALQKRNITIHPVAKLFVRSICMHFDRYLSKTDKEQRYSKVI